MKKDVGEAKPYEWDFDGSYEPEPGVTVHWNATFSVGVFQWVPKASGKGVKRSAVTKRFRGPVSNPEEVYARAQAYVAALNEEKPEMAVPLETPEVREERVDRERYVARRRREQKVAERIKMLEAELEELRGKR